MLNDEWIPFISSNVDAGHYDKGLLFIRFVNGSIYRYNNVPQEVWDGMLSADSKGKYLNAAVKGKFSYTKVA